MAGEFQWEHKGRDQGKGNVEDEMYAGCCMMPSMPTICG